MDEGKARREAIIEKIRKLKSMTESRGASEAEAAMAAKMMAKLMADFDIQQSELQIKEDAAHCINDTYMDISGHDNEWASVLMTVGQIFKTKYWFKKTTDDPLDLGVQQKVIEHNFYGFPQDVEAAKVLTGIIHAGVVMETSRWMKEVKSKRFVRNNIAAFHMGIASRLEEKLRPMIPVSRGTGLIVLKDQLVTDNFREYLRNAGINLKVSRGHGGPVNMDVYNRGRVSGGNIDVNQPRVARPALR